MRLVLDPTGVGHVVYEQAGSAVRARYARRAATGGVSSPMRVSTTLDGHSPSIALDSGGSPHLAFGDGSVYWVR